MKISLAIPNYNSLLFLKKYLQKNVSFTFYNAYLLDDYSEDGGVEFAETIPNLKVIKGKQNLGPAGNRNRILNNDLGEIILFLDSDMELLDDPIKALEMAFSDPAVGIVGGLILTEKKEPMWWNSGYEMGIVRELVLSIVISMARLFRNPYPVWLKKLARPFTYNLETPATRKVNWVAEGLFAVRTDLFKTVGGFDPKFTFHEGPDLYKRISSLGYSTLFYPPLSAIHYDANTRKGMVKRKVMLNSTIYWYKKHGLRL